MHSVSSVMSLLNTTYRKACLLLPFVAISLAGCNQGPAMSKVSGTVTYTDGSIPKGGVCVVRFEPAENSTATVRKGATSAINPDGTFELTTRVPGDGVYDGTYNVTFAVQKGPMDPTSYIQQKYQSAATTPYKNVKVEGDVTDLKFEIEPLPGAPKG